MRYLFAMIMKMILVVLFTLLSKKKIHVIDKNKNQLSLKNTG